MATAIATVTKPQNNTDNNNNDDNKASPQVICSDP